MLKVNPHKASPGGGSDDESFDVCGNKEEREIVIEDED
jgi:hypothetical protein